MTKFFNINNKRAVKTALEILKKNGVVIMPTETAYGLMADATNKKAIEKIYKIKGRNQSKFLPLIASSLGQIKKYFVVGIKEEELFKKYPGLTVVLEIKKLSPPKFLEDYPNKDQADRQVGENKETKGLYLVERQKTCAVRISKHELARELALKLGRPITATSANISGQDNCYSAAEVKQQLGLFFSKKVLKFKRPLGRFNKDAPKGAMKLGAVKYVDLVIDGGKLKKRKPSTIVKVRGGRVEVMRQGEIKI